MRKKIIIVFIILLILQTVQVTTVSYYIRQLQSAVSRVTITVEGREVSRSTSNLLDQFRNNVMVTAGMNFPVTGLKKFRGSWQAFAQRLNAMYDLTRKLSFDPILLSQLKEHIDLCIQRNNVFEQTVLNDAPDETYTGQIHNTAFELDEAIENAKQTLDVFVAKFVQEEESAALQEQRIHDLPIQAVSVIGLVIGCLLIAVGYFAVTRIVNPLIDLTIKYQVAMKKLKQEQEMALALEKARAKAQAKSDFMANMSHELRTPMNAILGFGQLLNESELEGKQKKYLDLIMSSGQHLVRIINDILDFSKLESGKVKLEHIDFNLEKTINEVIKIVSTRMAENPLDTYIDYPADLPKHIKSDPTRFKQILVNLLNNAIKFTSQGEVGIIVRLDAAIDHQDNEIPFRIAVKDSGIGIHNDKIDKIFESFTQVDESTTRKYGGTGLGLTITKSIVEAMGGRIWVESKEGVGSEFIFAIKVKKGKPVDQWKINEAAKKSLKGKTVFIIDDNQIARKIIKKNCESIGMEVIETADSGSDALAKLDVFVQKGIFPDVILCDIMMSEMFGYEVAQKLRTNKKFDQTKIIAVTKISEADVVHYIRDDCFNAYLTKPVSQAGMIDILSRECGYQSAEETEIHEKKEEVVEDVSSFKDIKILVAENNISNIVLIRECLKKLPCDVTYTYNGKEAIQRMESREYDLCLMDLQMPVIGGIEATKIIRKNISKTIPIIALTASVLREDRVKAMEAGMIDFIEKPFDIVQLKKKILQYGRPQKIQPKKTKDDQTKVRALIVDDNSLNLKLLMAFLKKLNCEGDMAINGEEAVAKVKNNSYDICFMDIQMPVMGGVEATKIIRNDISKDLPIIAVTAVSDFTYEKSIEAGMNDFMDKPVDVAKLETIISKYTKKNS